MFLKTNLVLLKKTIRMKKTLIILLYLPLIAIGQEKSFEIGVLFGGSHNLLNKNTVFNKETLKPMGGLLAQYNFTKRISIKSKILYHTKGGLGLEKLGNETHTHQLDLQYLTLPLLAQLNFGNNKWSFFCNTGVYLGYLIDEVSSTTINTGYVANKQDFGIMLGSGVSFRFSERIKILLESSFDYGLINTLTYSSQPSLTQATVVSTGLAYNFPAKKKTFNGTSTLKCADYNESPEIKEKKKSKWRLVLYKDGKTIGKKTKRGKSRLFKNKN